MKEKLTISAESPSLIKDTLSLLDQYGVLIITDFLNPEQLQKLIKEYEVILQTENEVIQHLPYPQGIAKKIDFPMLTEDLFPTTYQTFNNSFMKELCDSYLGTPNHFNHEIYVARDEYEKVNALNEMHYDKLSTLKFFLYLNDIDQSNGAFEAVPSSHKLAQEFMREHRKRGKKLVNLPNRDLPKEFEKGLAMEAKAGSMIVFTTDTYHRAGRVEKGKNRMIMRGHCRRDPMPKYAPTPLSKQWMEESFLNPSRYYYALSDLMTKKA